jgi:hypothetical protein
LRSIRSKAVTAPSAAGTGAPSACYSSCHRPSGLPPFAGAG